MTFELDVQLGKIKHHTDITVAALEADLIHEICSAPTSAEDRWRILEILMSASGTARIGIATGPAEPLNIVGMTVASPTEITTSAAHGLSNGNTALVVSTTSAPVIMGLYSVTVTAPTTFTIPVNVSSGGNVIGRVLPFAAWAIPPISFLAVAGANAIELQHDYYGGAGQKLWLAQNCLGAVSLAFAAEIADL